MHILYGTQSTTTPTPILSPNIHLEACGPNPDGPGIVVTSTSATPPSALPLVLPTPSSVAPIPQTPPVDSTQAPSSSVSVTLPTLPTHLPPVPTTVPTRVISAGTRRARSDSSTVDEEVYTGSYSLYDV